MCERLIFIPMHHVHVLHSDEAPGCTKPKPEGEGKNKGSLCGSCRRCGRASASQFTGPSLSPEAQSSHGGRPVLVVVQNYPLWSIITRNILSIGRVMLTHSTRLPGFPREWH